MPQILSLLKYSFTNQRSVALNVYSVLATIWATGWLVLWTLAFIAVSGEYTGTAVEIMGSVCAWFAIVVAFCLLPIIIQIGWALKVRREEAAAMPGPWLYGPAPVFQAPPVPPAYQPAYIGGGYRVTDRLLEEEKRRTRELEYENVLLKQKVRDQESARRSMTTVEKLVEAQGLEHERRYDEAGQVYEEMGRWEDASRVRMLQIKGGNP